MREQVLSAAASRGIFFSPDALEMILSNNEPMEFTNTVFAHLAKNTMFVSKQDIMDCIAGDKILHESPKEIKPRNKFTSDISIVNGTDVTGQSTCEGKVNDFAQYIKARFFTMKRIIEKRNDFGKAISIERAMTLDREVRVIGIIYDVSITKNGHTMLSMEDETGIVKVFISKDSPISNELFVDDEVIGVIGRPSSRTQFISAERIVRPDVPKSHKWEVSDSTSKIAFLSDCHVGSSTFLEPQWRKMTSWLKQNAEDEGINYLVFPGDVVDGIGVFPDQEKELDIPDIYLQYEKLAEYLKEIPDHIKMVIHPGNHDAARPAEPQPALNSVFTKGFDSNILMVGNPVYLNVEGRTVLTYHGKSIDDWVASVQYLTYEDPLKVMKEMCIRRHLAPIYGARNALAPEKKDYLAMEYVPDIFVSGHVHGAGQLQYNGVRLINASTWQSQTEYQKLHNFNPDPAIMPVVDLAEGRIEMRDFN